MNLKKTGQLITTWWGMWLLFFVYTAALAVFVQLVLIPQFAPDMNYGHGLFVLDATGFHDTAQEQAKAMMKDGWKAWQLFPQNRYPAGIASIFYYLWRPEPFTVIPFNAVLHATAGCLVFFLLSFFIKDRMAAFGGAALFVLNPASLEWTAQIHRDGTFILGNLLVLVSWLLISKGIKTEKWGTLIYSLFAFFMGTLMIWVSRPYWTRVVAGACAVLIAVMFFHMMVAWYRSGSITSHQIASFLLVCIMLAMQKPLMEKGSSIIKRYSVIVGESLRTSQEGGVIERGRFRGIAVIRNHIHGSIVVEGQYKGVFFPDKIEWRLSPLIPNFIESKLRELASFRLWVSQEGGKSIIDPEFQFMSAKDYLLYLPRALQVGFLSPFPSMCFTRGNTMVTSVGRAVLGPVTIFFYICIASFVWGSRIYWKNRDFWLVVLYCTCGLLIYTYAYPNVGILLRFRYGFFMTIVSIGFAFAIMKINHRGTETQRKDQISMITAKGKS